METHIDIIEAIAGHLATANVAVPIIFGAIQSISAIIKGATGTGPSLSELADVIDRQVASNDTAGKAEIARLRALIG